MKLSSKVVAVVPNGAPETYNSMYPLVNESEGFKDTTGYDLPPKLTT